jgi:hypothetical protein
MTEAIGEHVDGRTVFSQCATLGDSRVDRITGGWREDQAGGFLLVHPFVGAFFFAHGNGFFERFQQPVMTAIVALERVDRAGEIGEALQVFAVLEVVAAHGRRKAQHFGFLVGAQQRDCVVEPVDHVLEYLAAAIQAVLACINEDSRFNQTCPQRHVRRVVGRCLLCIGGCNGRVFRYRVHVLDSPRSRRALRKQQVRRV